MRINFWLVRAIYAKSNTVHRPSCSIPLLTPPNSPPYHKFPLLSLCSTDGVQKVAGEGPPWGVIFYEELMKKLKYASNVLYTEQYESDIKFNIELSIKEGKSKFVLSIESTWATWATVLRVGVAACSSWFVSSSIPRRAACVRLPLHTLFNFS